MPISTRFEAGTTAVTLRFEVSARSMGTANSNVTVRMFGDLIWTSGRRRGLRGPQGNLNFFQVTSGTPPFTAPLIIADLDHDTAVGPSDFAR